MRDGGGGEWTAGALRFARPTFTVSESGRTAVIEMVRDVDDVGPQTATLDVAGGTALEGFDFVGVSNKQVRGGRARAPRTAACIFS